MEIEVKIEHIKVKLRDIVSEVISDTTGLEMSISDRESLIDGGIIDSLSMVTLISTMEMNFEVFIHPAELSIENFDTIEKIADFLHAKLNGDNLD